ncbi:hypothetical protein N7532_001846 [Penicillium argentinense]|uniref:catechol O-methyltransferase n=1 Tax=Penicillium argentinense TaxID=1131581 RepID=A0A9W9G3A0_9EURO|nr:uncharacterized protein N7532_001846 [Penicillium argentinense]KAJ5111311.1 hypothetical protein N7532_001846 [Penicillium argentinense]
MSNRPHAPPAHVIGQDGRETDLLHWMYARSDIKQLRGNPQKVIAAIDEYHTKHNQLMNIGAVKGAAISDLIAQRKPSIMFELGGYVGYSAVLFGNSLKAHGGRFVSIEKNPEMAAVANQLVDLAGLRENVRILVGSSNEVLEELVREKKELKEVEMMFIDHWQRLYLPDLWLLEELGVLVPGKTMLIADNVIMPGAPDYLQWVKASPEEKKKLLSKLNVGSHHPNPDLVFETVVPEYDTDFGKDGLAITKVL